MRLAAGVVILAGAVVTGALLAAWTLSHRFGTWVDLKVIAWREEWYRSHPPKGS